MLQYFFVFGLRIPSYSFSLVTGVLLSSLICIRRFRRSGGDINDAIIVLACCLGLAMLGSVLLYYIATFGLIHIIRSIFSGNLSFVNSIGLVYYGGLLGGVAGALLGFGIANMQDKRVLLNALVPCIPLGHAIGRVGCFLGGCCYGIPYQGACAVVLADAGLNHSVFPVQILESALNVALFVALSAYIKRNPGTRKAFILYLALYAPIRFFLEFLRGDAIRGSWIGLSTSQLISILILLVSAAGMLFLKESFPWNKHRQQP